MNYSSILHIHTMIGVVVLTSFWVTAFSKKGGRVHRISGKIYLVGILVIIVSVIPMIVLALQQKNNGQAIGLAFLSVMTFVAAWIASQSIARKREIETYRNKMFVTLALALSAFGLVVLALNILHWSFLYIFFACTGLTLAGSMWFIIFKKEVNPGWHLSQHLNGVALLFAATHGSFLRFGLTKLIPLIPDSKEFNTFAQTTVILLALLLRLTLGKWYVKKFFPKVRKPESVAVV
ncbi:MAG TPA: hypothetical protein VK589_25865 [Chryseolinea sp.]|nr:hypothetical protein [Chryseolinea sp.]